MVFFNRLAEIAGEYLKKGSQVYVEGALRTRKWQDKEGKERYTTEIVAERMQMLGSRAGMGDAGAATRATTTRRRSPAGGEGKSAKKPAGKFDDMDDDIPFYGGHARRGSAVKSQELSICTGSRSLARMVEPDREFRLQAGSSAGDAERAGAISPRGTRSVRAEAFAQQQWNKAAFDTKSVADTLKALGGSGSTESAQIQITAPDIAENGAVVPITIESGLARTQTIAILIEKNPSTLSAEFRDSRRHRSLRHYPREDGRDLQHLRGGQGRRQVLSRREGDQGHSRRVRGLIWPIRCAFARAWRATRSRCGC